MKGYDEDQTTRLSTSYTTAFYLLTHHSPPPPPPLAPQPLCTRAPFLSSLLYLQMINTATCRTRGRTNRTGSTGKTFAPLVQTAGGPMGLNIVLLQTLIIRKKVKLMGGGTSSGGKHSSVPGSEVVAGPRHSG